MRCGRILSVAGFVIIALGITGFSKTIPGRWEKVDELTAGRGLLVTLQGGDRFECSFVSSTSESLTVREKEGRERELPKSGVKKVETIEKTGRGNLLDGTLIGAAIGGAVMAIAVAAVDDSDGSGPAIAAGIGIGAGIGLACDAAVGAREVLYKQATKSTSSQVEDRETAENQRASN